MTAKGCGKIRWVVASLIVLAMGISLAIGAEKVSLLTKEELKSMMGNPELITIDVRTHSDWEKSQEKIKGAVREDPNKAAKSWAGKYPKDKTVVLYCA